MAPVGQVIGYAGAWQAKAEHSGPEAECIFSDGVWLSACPQRSPVSSQRT